MHCLAWGSWKNTNIYMENNKLEIPAMKQLMQEFNIQLQDPSEEAFKQHLVNRINYLIEHDFYALIQLLYRIDINEGTLKDTLSANTSMDAGDLIAELIIHRQLEKIALKKQFKQQDDINEADRW